MRLFVKFWHSAVGAVGLKILLDRLYTISEIILQVSKIHRCKTAEKMLLPT